MAEDDDDEFEVEKILGERIKHGVLQYRIKWENYEDATWEPAENLSCPTILEQYQLMKRVKAQLSLNVTSPSPEPSTSGNRPDKCFLASSAPTMGKEKASEQRRDPAKVRLIASESVAGLPTGNGSPMKEKLLPTRPQVAKEKHDAELLKLKESRQKWKEKKGENVANPASDMAPRKVFKTVSKLTKRRLHPESTAVLSKLDGHKDVPNAAAAPDYVIKDLTSDCEKSARYPVKTSKKSSSVKAIHKKVRLMALSSTESSSSDCETTHRSELAPAATFPVVTTTAEIVPQQAVEVFRSSLSSVSFSTSARPTDQGMKVEFNRVVCVDSLDAENSSVSPEILFPNADGSRFEQPFIVQLDSPSANCDDIGKVRNYAMGISSEKPKIDTPNTLPDIRPVLKSALRTKSEGQPKMTRRVSFRFFPDKQADPDLSHFTHETHKTDLSVEEHSSVAKKRGSPPPFADSHIHVNSSNGCSEAEVAHSGMYEHSGAEDANTQRKTDEENLVQKLVPAYSCSQRLVIANGRVVRPKLACIVRRSLDQDRAGYLVQFKDKGECEFVQDNEMREHYLPDLLDFYEKILQQDCPEEFDFSQYDA